MQYMNEPMTDRELLELLKQEQSLAFKKVYHRYYKMVAVYITKNSGSREDVEDIFQDALFVLVKKVREPDFKLTAKLGTYLYGIVEKIWLNKLRGEKSIIPIDEMEEELEMEEGGILEKERVEAKHQLIKMVFKELPEACQTLLKTYYYEKQSLKKIAEQMGYTSYFIKVKKHRCMNEFKKRVEDHSDFGKTQDDE